MAILTQTHREHFDEYGYMVIENAVPTELCDAVVDAIFAFLEMDPSDPNDWYRAPHKPGQAWWKCTNTKPCGTSTNIHPSIKSIRRSTAPSESGYTPTAST